MRQHVSPEMRRDFWEQIPEHLYDTGQTNDAWPGPGRKWTKDGHLLICFVGASAVFLGGGFCTEGQQFYWDI